MKKISGSANRHGFQKESYIKRQKEKNKPVIKELLDLMDKIADSHIKRFDDPKLRENNLEYDLLTNKWILEKVRNSETYSQNLYAAICNNSFQKLDVIPILKEERWSCSWRYAGGIIADMREEGDYIDWYCSGIGPVEGDKNSGFVSESVITDEIRADLKKLGWIVIEDNL